MTRNFLPALIVALAGFLLLALVWPQYQAVQTRRQAIQAVQALTAERQTWQENVANLTRQYQSRRADVANLNLLLPERRQLDQIIVNLQAAASQSGLQLREVTLSDNQGTGSPKQVAIKLNAGGSYPGLMTWLREVEQSLRLYDVGDISLARDLGGGGYSLEVKLNTYNLK